MSGMPAWGRDHDDATLWSIVAFVNKLPAMTPQQYKEIVSKAPPDEEMEGMKSENETHMHVDGDKKLKKHQSAPMGNMPGMR